MDVFSSERSKDHTPTFYPVRDYRNTNRRLIQWETAGPHTDVLFSERSKDHTATSETPGLYRRLTEWYTPEPHRRITEWYTPRPQTDVFYSEEPHYHIRSSYAVRDPPDLTPMSYPMSDLGRHTDVLSSELAMPMLHLQCIYQGECKYNWTLN